MLCRRLRAKHTLTPLHRVQVNFEDFILGQHQLHHIGHADFLGLAQITAVGREKQVFGQLHGDGRTARDDFTAPFVAFFCGVDGVPIHAVVLDKARILRGHDGFFQIVRNLAVAAPIALQ